MQKRVLFLGGAYAQIPIIKEAKSRNWYIITCDYLPDNPGHKLADEYYNISTTDIEGVYNLAKQVKPDFIIAYASDPAAPVASCVSERLGLPGNSYESVRILSEKDRFRNFLRENGFNTPKTITITEEINNIDLVDDLEFPLIVKPTDSSGSKGVSKVENKKEIQKAIEYALSFSRNKRVIIEEFIDNEIADIHGDGFVINNELVFSCLGDHIYNSLANPFNPTGTSWPSKIPIVIIQRIEKEVDRLIQLSGFLFGPINIEARINKRGLPYIMEIGPRNGGHFVPQAINYATKFDMVSSFLNLLDGNEISISKNFIIPSAYIAVHSEYSGILDSIIINDKLKPFIKEFHQYINKGEEVKSFQGSNAAIGILLLSFTTIEEMDHYIENIDSYVKVILK